MFGGFGGGRWRVWRDRNGCEKCSKRQQRGKEEDERWWVVEAGKEEN